MIESGWISNDIIPMLQGSEFKLWVLILIAWIHIKIPLKSEAFKFISFHFVLLNLYFKDRSESSQSQLGFATSFYNNFFFQEIGMGLMRMKVKVEPTEEQVSPGYPAYPYFCPDIRL